MRLVMLPGPQNDPEMGFKIEVSNFIFWVFFQEPDCPLLPNRPRASKVPFYFQNCDHMDRFSPSSALFFNYLSYFLFLVRFPVSICFVLSAHNCYDNLSEMSFAVKRTWDNSPTHRHA